MNNVDIERGKRLKDECVEWIREWFERNGKDCRAVIGISGGKDSSVVAALCVEALGKDRVIGVLMPNGEQQDINDSYRLCKHLDILDFTVDISPAVNAISLGVSKSLMDCSLSEQTRINLPPRIRMATLYAFSQTVNGRVINTCNLSEDYIGYSTRYGDAAGDCSPLGGLLTDEVIAIGLALGLPEDLVYKVPADGLCEKTDEDNLGFSYDVLNYYIRTGKCEDEEVKNNIKTRHEKNKFKMLPMPYFNPYE